MTPLTTQLDRHALHVNLDTVADGAESNSKKLRPRVDFKVDNGRGNIRFGVNGEMVMRGNVRPVWSVRPSA